jgi:hypothetical protein
MVVVVVGCVEFNRLSSLDALCLVLSSLVYNCTSVDGRWLLDGDTVLNVRSIFDLTLDTITCPVSCRRSSSSIVHDCFQRNVRGLHLSKKKMREIVNSALGTVPLIKLDRAVSRATHWPTIMTRGYCFHLTVV